MWLGCPLSLRPHWWVETDIFKQLRILNAFEIALWQTGTTSKRADVIDLPALQPQKSANDGGCRCPRHVAAEQKTYGRFGTITRGCNRFKSNARVS